MEYKEYFLCPKCGSMLRLYFKPAYKEIYEDCYFLCPKCGFKTKKANGADIQKIVSNLVKKAGIPILYNETWAKDEPTYYYITLQNNKDTVKVRCNTWEDLVKAIKTHQKFGYKILDISKEINIKNIY